jgi:hypothetical protein
VSFRFRPSIYYFLRCGNVDQLAYAKQLREETINWKKDKRRRRLGLGVVSRSTSSPLPSRLFNLAMSFYPFTDIV